MNVPNALTITRIVLTPVVLAAYMLNFPAHFLVATILYFIAGMTGRSPAARTLSRTSASSPTRSQTKC